VMRPDADRISDNSITSCARRTAPHVDQLIQPRAKFCSAF
jgi:hypothetical protein